MSAGELERDLNDQHLIAFLRREAAYSGVWFARQLDEAADRLAALRSASPPASEAGDGPTYNGIPLDELARSESYHPGDDA